MGKRALARYKRTRILSPNVLSKFLAFGKIMATTKPANNSKRKEIEAKKKVKRKARREKQAASLRERRQKRREAKKEAAPKE